MQNVWICIVAVCFACSNVSQSVPKEIIPGAYDLTSYLPLLKGKKVGLCVNHSAMIEKVHLVDSLRNLGIDVMKVFTPEHGFTGTTSDGVSIRYNNHETPFKLISLYGKSKKPTIDQMQEIDIMVFDIQDVGVRFYTYISTMHYVMEACAENNVPLIILDRPNPNGSYIDGPVLDTAFRSFIGIHPIPIVHGLTVGELARMINGEGWLKNEAKCDLTVIRVKNWDHSKTYPLPIKPSPNLPNELSTSLYPSLCLFEGTIMSVGRGTDHPFQQVGHPNYPDTTYSFIPTSREGARWPPYEKEKCFGLTWKDQSISYQFTLAPLIEAYKKMDSKTFFNDYFTKLVGNDHLQKQIETGMSEAAIKKTWNDKLAVFKEKRLKYLLYN